MNFAEIEKEINNLAKKAVAGSISMDDMAGGSFTISNGGVYGSLLSTPIINPPQVDSFFLLFIPLSTFTTLCLLSTMKLVSESEYHALPFYLTLPFSSVYMTITVCDPWYALYRKPSNGCRR